MNQPTLEEMAQQFIANQRLQPLPQFYQLPKKQHLSWVIKGRRCGQTGFLIRQLELERALKGKQIEPPKMQIYWATPKPSPYWSSLAIIRLDTIDLLKDITP